MPGHVFVSYSVVDEVYVRRLVRHLRSSGVEVWLDAEGRADGGNSNDGEGGPADQGSSGGEHWDHVVAAKVDTCAAFVAVMTPESGRSESVGREVARARDSQRPILPLLLAGRPVLDLAGDEYEDVVGRRMPAPGFVARLRELAPGPEPVAPPVESAADPTGAGPAGPARPVRAEQAGPVGAEPGPVGTAPAGLAGAEQKRPAGAEPACPEGTAPAGPVAAGPVAAEPAGVVEGEPAGPARTERKASGRASARLRTALRGVLRPWRRRPTWARPKGGDTAR